MKRVKLQRKVKTPWTERLGNKIGVGLNKLFANKVFTGIFITVMLVIFFVFIVDIRKNIISICILAVLAVASIVLKIIEKKK